MHIRLPLLTLSRDVKERLLDHPGYFSADVMTIMKPCMPRMPVISQLMSLKLVPISNSQLR
jgi:hypothetical protein